jgi:UDP-glucose 4-epimerase
VAAARVTDVATVLIGDRPIETIVTGIRPGEKIHEILVSEEESFRTLERAGYFVLQSQLPELAKEEFERALHAEYSSADSIVTGIDLEKLVSLAEFVDPAMSGPGAPVVA